MGGLLHLIQLGGAWAGCMRPRQVPSSLYQMQQSTHQRPVYQFHFIRCGTFARLTYRAFVLSIRNKIRLYVVWVRFTRDFQVTTFYEQQVGKRIYCRTRVIVDHGRRYQVS